jgi:hypothetical protein
MGLIRDPETSVNNYHTTPRNIQEERRYHQHRGGSLKSRPYTLLVGFFLKVYRQSLLESMRKLDPWLKHWDVGHRIEDVRS